MFRATPNALPEIIVRLLKVGLNKLLGHVVSVLAPAPKSSWILYMVFGSAKLAREYVLHNLAKWGIPTHQHAMQTTTPVTFKLKSW
jgi:hypothetical protein